MQDHDFENRVHLKMEEMKILPSEDVWEKVELRLHQKEARRRWIIWLPLLLGGLPLLLAGLSLGSYWTWNKLHTSSEKQSPSLSNTQKVKLNNHNNSTSIKDKEITKVDNKTAAIILHTNQEKAIINIDSKNASHNRIKNQQENREAREQPDHQAIHKNISGTSPGIPNKSLNKKSQDLIVQTEILPSLENKLPEVSQPENNIAISDITDKESLVQQEITKDIFPAKVKDFPLPANSINTSLLFLQHDLNTKIATKLQGLNKSWQWGLSFQAGRSSLTSGSLNKLFGSPQADFLSNSPSSQPNNNISPSAVYKEPSPLKPAIGFSAGIFAKKQLSRTFAISIGLNYTLYSTTNMAFLELVVKLLQYN